MNFTRPEQRLTQLFFALVLITLAFTTTFEAQSRKSNSRKPAQKRAELKKKQSQARDARKDTRSDSRREQLAKNSRKNETRRERATAKDSRKQPLTAKDRSRDDRNSKEKLNPRNRAEARRAALERKKAEQARRLAVLAERRRREQAAREARARRMAFERGLREETAINIGKDDVEGEDPIVRRAAVNALGNTAGTVVVMEAQTGKLVTIVNQDWAIRKSFKPCSTIKLVTGVAGINENVIDDGGQIRGSSSIDLHQALARSKNRYFQRVGSNIGNKKMVDYARSLGLGEPTGINAEGESAGRLAYGNSNPRIYSHGDDFEVTPLQLAVMVSAISNGGNKVVPQIPRHRYERSTFEPQVKQQLDLPQTSFEGVLPGMIGAAEYGTASRGVDSSMGVAGKTGSCIYRGSWIGLFASVAPIEDPKYSVVVITRGERQRGRHAAAVAGTIYQTLRTHIHRDPTKLVARRKAVKADSDIRIADRSDSGDDEEEDSETDAQDSVATTEDEEARDAQPKAVATERYDMRPKVVAGAPQYRTEPALPSRPKLVQKTGQSRPINFPPVVITYDKEAAEKPQQPLQRPRIVKNK